MVPTQKPDYYPAPDCASAACDWVNLKKGDRMTCDSGYGGCTLARLVEAYESVFHDQDLMEATRKINRILAKIPEDPHGRKLSFCHTKMGSLLAWVEHGGKVKGPRVTAQDDNETVAKALKLKLDGAKTKGGRPR